MGTFFALPAPLCGEFISHRRIPLTKANDAELWWFLFDQRLNKRLSKQSICRWFDTPSNSLWRHCNDIITPTVLNIYRHVLLQVIGTNRVALLTGGKSCYIVMQPQQIYNKKQTKISYAPQKHTYWEIQISILVSEHRLEIRLSEQPPQSVWQHTRVPWEVQICKGNGNYKHDESV